MTPRAVNRPGFVNLTSRLFLVIHIIRPQIPTLSPNFDDSRDLEKHTLILRGRGEPTEKPWGGAAFIPTTLGKTTKRAKLGCKYLPNFPGKTKSTQVCECVCVQREKAIETQRECQKVEQQSNSYSNYGHFQKSKHLSTISQFLRNVAAFRSLK